MATFLATFLFLMMAITSCSSAEVVRIERDSNLSHDDFLLPDSECPMYKPKCSSFNGTPLSICWCTCEDIQSQTSAFYESSFGCVQVSSIRQQAGMIIHQMLIVC